MQGLSPRQRIASSRDELAGLAAEVETAGASRGPRVPVMQPADLRDRDDAALTGWFDLAGRRRKTPFHELLHPTTIRLRRDDADDVGHLMAELLADCQQASTVVRAWNDPVAAELAAEDLDLGFEKPDAGVPAGRKPAVTPRAALVY